MKQDIITAFTSPWNKMFTKQIKRIHDKVLLEQRLMCMHLRLADIFKRDR